MINVTRFFFLVSIDKTFIYEAKIYEYPTSNADITLIVFQCLALDLLQNDFKKGWESRHRFRTLKVVMNQSPLLLMNTAVRLALLYILMACMTLALMLYCVIGLRAFTTFYFIFILNLFGICAGLQINCI